MPRDQLHGDTIAVEVGASTSILDDLAAADLIRLSDQANPWRPAVESYEGNLWYALSSGERALLLIARLLGEVEVNASLVDQRWRHRIAGVLDGLADELRGAS